MWWTTQSAESAEDDRLTDPARGPPDQRRTIRRRDLMRTGVVAAGALALGAGFWRVVLSGDGGGEAATDGYGALRSADENGLMLPPDFRSRVVARGGEPVPGTDHRWHIFSDGAATFDTGGGGWILVSNCEAEADRGGGAEAIRFTGDGDISAAYRILGGTNVNCAGGATPWGTWLSCEEVDEGRVWECDPTGDAQAEVRPALGVFKHEAVAVEPSGRRLYLTEDIPDGGFYRFTAENPRDLRDGTLEIATIAPDRRVTWSEVPDPHAPPVRRQVPGYTRFRRGEGIWYDSGTVYIATTQDSTIHAYDTDAETLDVVYAASRHVEPPLTNVDNITVSRSGELFVCEDNNRPRLDMRTISPDRKVAPFLTATGHEHRGSELAGVVFNPVGDRLYFSSQRARALGAVYEITGPFRG
jgi:secreted PhoX family phosphatase